MKKKIYQRKIQVRLVKYKFKINNDILFVKIIIKHVIYITEFFLLLIQGASDVAFKTQQNEIKIRLNKSNRKVLNEIKFVRSCRKQSKLIFNTTSTFLEQSLRFQVNFDYNLIETIHEVI